MTQDREDKTSLPLFGGLVEDIRGSMDQETNSDRDACGEDECGGRVRICMRVGNRSDYVCNHDEMLCV